ncbi:MAG: glycyl radical protein, partial [Deltaproteobacteria bacterium]|nr:glycyl radical protein [Deltaproteobacteria bacterium]
MGLEGQPFEDQAPSKLSPQEERLWRPGSAPLPGQRERVSKLLERSQGLKPVIDIERALHFTRSMARTEGEHLSLRWAKALYEVAKNITVRVADHQLLLGRIGPQGRYGILYPELDGNFLGLAVASLPSRAGSPAEISEEDAKIVAEEISPYWRGRTYHEALSRALPPDVRALTYGDPEGLASRFIVNETSSFRSSIQWVHDYGKALKFGLKDVARKASEKLEALDPFSPSDQCDRKPFYEAVLIVCEGAALFARRQAQAAREAAAVEADPKRRAELENLAEICERVPWEPARTFHEALQSQWLIQLFSRLEQKTGTIISNGRMDQYLWPFYEKDKREGRIDEERALELLECLWVGLYEFVDLYISPAGGAFNEGYAHWEAVTIGGQRP